jgi:hypothetical protein
MFLDVGRLLLCYIRDVLYYVKGDLIGKQIPIGRLEDKFVIFVDQNQRRCAIFNSDSKLLSHTFINDE